MTISNKTTSELLKILSIIIALSAVLIFVFYLILSYNKCIIFTEPNTIIRVSEISLGIISILVLGGILWGKINNFYKK